jgi:hypothetical protein
MKRIFSLLAMLFGLFAVFTAKFSVIESNGNGVQKDRSTIFGGGSGHSSLFGYSTKMKRRDGGSESMATMTHIKRKGNGTILVI